MPLSPGNPEKVPGVFSNFPGVIMFQNQGQALQSHISPFTHVLLAAFSL